MGFNRRIFEQLQKPYAVNHPGSTGYANDKSIFLRHADPCWTVFLFTMMIETLEIMLQN